MDFDEITQLSDDDARAYVERIRWPRGQVCPHCNGSAVTRLQGKSTRPRLYKCRAKTCRKQFTVTVGTVFADSHLPLRFWLTAIGHMCSIWGISAHTLHRKLGITYKSARHLCACIRYAMSQPPLAEMLAHAREAEGMGASVPQDLLEALQSFGEANGS